MLSDTKDIFCMDDHVLIMTYKFLSMGSLKCHILDTVQSPKDDCVVKMGFFAIDI